jgi:hypothetical protein
MGFGFGHASHHPVAASRNVERRPRDYSAFQGACVVMAGCAVLAALVIGGMVAMTGPDGWITKAANTAVMGDSNVAMTTYIADQGR